MRNLLHCLIALLFFTILFVISTLAIYLFDNEIDKTSDLISLFGANATLFGALVIIYGLNQWKDQSNIHLSRDLALKASECIANEMDSLEQIYVLFKGRHSGFHIISSKKFEKLPPLVSSLFEKEWDLHISASYLFDRNCKRLMRINNDTKLKNMLKEYNNQGEKLSNKLENIYNIRMRAENNPQSQNIDFTSYSLEFTEIESQFKAFKALSNRIDEYLDNYIVLSK